MGGTKHKRADGEMNRVISMLGHSKGLLSAVNHGEFDISSVPRVAAIVSVEASFQLERSLIFLREIGWVVFCFSLAYSRYR